MPAAFADSYPEAERSNHVDTYHGTKVPDPYRWMEDVDSDKTRAWVKAEQAFTEEWFSKAPERAAWQKRMAALWKFEQMPLSPDGIAGVMARGGRIFSLRQGGNENQPVVYVQDGPNGKPRPLLDPNAMSKQGTVAISTLQPSPDGKWLAYGIAKAGSDWQTWHVRSVDTGKDSADQLEWIKFSSPAWLADSTGFYYARYDAPKGNQLTAENSGHQVWRHRLGAAQSSDIKIFERPNEKNWIIAPTVSEDGRYLALAIFQGSASKNLIYYQDLKTPNAPIRELVPEFYALQYFLGIHDGKFIVHTTWQAPKGRVVAIDPAKPDRDAWKELVAESEQTLKEASMEGHEIALNYMRDATSVVRTYSLRDSKTHEVPLPANASISLADRSTRYYSLASFVAPQTIYDCGAANGRCRPLADLKQSFDPSGLETKQVFYTSKDGTKVPMFLIHRKGLKLDGSNPVLLYGYGGFDQSMTPSFSPRFLAVAEQGGVAAVANLRGGGEYGQAWHEAGMKDKKQNVFDDFISAAEWLIAQKYTVSKKLAILGGSNGGLLVGAVMNQRPDLFGAAIPAVGVMDMLRFHKFTIGAAWAPEYGSADNPEDFPVLFRYSPLHNIKPGASYPPTLIMTADHDDRVVPSHSFKYAATLQKAQGGEAPILIRIATSAGHGAGKPKTMRSDEDADVLTFLTKTIGLPAPQAE
jgi:prolyl oligopeptidase